MYCMYIMYIMYFIAEQLSSVLLSRLIITLKSCYFKFEDGESHAILEEHTQYFCCEGLER